MTNTCEKIVCGRSDTVFCPGQETFQRPFESNTKLLEHCAQSPIHEFMLAVWPSITVIIQLLNIEIQLLNNYIYIFLLLRVVAANLDKIYLGYLPVGLDMMSHFWSMVVKLKRISKCLLIAVDFLFLKQNLLLIQDFVTNSRAILCARSNYFSAMLYGDWVEGKTNEIPLIG